MVAFIARLPTSLPRALAWTGLASHFYESMPTSALLSKSAVRYIEAIGKRYDFPGIGIGLVASPNKMGGDDWYTEVLTLGNGNGTGDHFSMDTTFHLASNSKLFTAMSIGLLIDNGTRLVNGRQLDYDTKVRDILPHWSMVDRYMHHNLDLTDLLAMRTGMPSHRGSHVPKDTKEMVKRFRHLRPSAEIRQAMQYNDYNYWVLAEIIAEVTGMSVADYVQVHIFDPLNMTSATWNHTAAFGTGHLASGYEREGRDQTKCREVWRQEGRFDRSCHGRSTEIEWFVEGDGLFHAGPAGLVSSMGDMLKWLQELMSPRILPSDKVALSHQSFITAFDRVTRYDEISTMSYGHAQMIMNYPGRTVILHIGTHPGAACLVARVPTLEIGFFIATTELTLGSTFNFVILYRILDDLLKLDPIDWEYRLYTSKLISEDEFTEPPKPRRPPPARKEIEGIYHDQAYGYLHIDHIDNAQHSSTAFDPVFTTYMRSEGSHNSSSMSSTYFASLPGVYFSGLWLDHFDGPLFNATAFGLRHKVGGGVIPISYGTFTAVIVPGEGLGMFDNFWAGDPGKIPMGEKGKIPVEDAAEDEAEVWFYKLDCDGERGRYRSQSSTAGWPLVPEADSECACC